MIQISIVLVKDTNRFIADKSLLDIVQDIFGIKKTRRSIKLRDIANTDYQGVTFKRDLLTNADISEDELNKKLKDKLVSTGLEFYIQAIWYDSSDRLTNDEQFYYDNELCLSSYICFGQVDFGNN